MPVPLPASQSSWGGIVSFPDNSPTAGQDSRKRPTKGTQPAATEPHSRGDQPAPGPELPRRSSTDPALCRKWPGTLALRHTPLLTGRLGLTPPSQATPGSRPETATRRGHTRQSAAAAPGRLGCFPQRTWAPVGRGSPPAACEVPRACLTPRCPPRAWTRGTWARGRTGPYYMKAPAWSAWLRSPGPGGRFLPMPGPAPSIKAFGGPAPPGCQIRELEPAQVGHLEVSVPAGCPPRSGGPRPLGPAWLTAVTSTARGRHRESLAFKAPACCSWLCVHTRGQTCTHQLDPSHSGPGARTGASAARVLRSAPPARPDAELTQATRRAELTFRARPVAESAPCHTRGQQSCVWPSASHSCPSKPVTAGAPSARLSQTRHFCCFYIYLGSVCLFIEENTKNAKILQGEHERRVRCRPVQTVTPSEPL